jgi:hypothetical protein
MAKTASKYGFVECADLVSEQRYGAALKMFQRAATKFLESKISPNRNEIARQLLQIGAVLEETLSQAYGARWDSHVPKVSEKEANCSFCGKKADEVQKLIAGPAVHICDECVKLCGDIVAEEAGHDTAAKSKKPSSKDAQADRLCGICMEPRETDELIFLPHAAYMCPGCLEDIQTVREKHGEK